MNTEINRLIAIIERESVERDFKHLEGIHIGSDERTKGEIIDIVCSRANDGRRFLSFCLDCLAYLNNGFTLEQFIERQIKESQKPSTMKTSRLKTEEHLARLVPELMNDFI